MRVLIAGGTGFIGRSIIAALLERDVTIVALTRSLEKARAILGQNVQLVRWDDIVEQVDGADVVFNFAGSSIAQGRWTKQRKREIVESRIQTTSQLVATINRAQNPPKIFISASAIGYYGNRGDEELTENSSPGEGFLSELCKEWEKAAFNIQQHTRVVCLRLGVVIGKGGGITNRLVPIISRVGSITPGSGKQWFSWVDIEDVVRATLFLISATTVYGPVNVVSPHPVQMREFMQLLANRYGRPMWFRVPESILRLMLGQLATTLTDSQYVLPKCLLDCGYQFRYSLLEESVDRL